MLFIFIFVILYYSMNSYPFFQIQKYFIDPKREIKLKKAWVLYHRPWSLSGLHGILAVPKGVLLCIMHSNLFLGICLSHSSSLGVITLRVSVTTGTTVAITFLTLLTSYHAWHALLIRLRYLG